MSYQIRDGKPQVGYYGNGLDSEDYKAMNTYLQVKKIKIIIKKVLQTKIKPLEIP